MGLCFRIGMLLGLVVVLRLVWLLVEVTIFGSVGGM